MKREAKKNKKNLRGRRAENYFFEEDYEFETDNGKPRKRKDVGKRAHRKKTLKDDFWGDH